MFLIDRQGIGPVGGERYEGADGLMRVIEQLEGIALPTALWESAVFPARVRDYQPALLDELLTSGDVVWVGSKTGGTSAMDPGEVAFYPADSILLSGVEHGTTSNASDATMPEAILTALDSGGAFHARQLVDAAKRVWNEAAEPDINPNTGEIIPQEWSEQQFKDALWSLVWQGKVTNSSFAPVRALTAGAASPRKSTTSRRRGRVAPIHRATTDMTLGGLWSAVIGQAEAEDTDQTEQALALVETLLDRYGVIAQPVIDKENIPGGYSALYPILQRMEEHGRLVRGMFVRGFGAAQFAERDTVDALRHPSEHRGQSVVALSVLDPANLSGSAIAWPDAPAGAGKTGRRIGATVVLNAQGALLYAAAKAKHLTAFDQSVGHEPAANDSDEQMRKAATELAYALKRNGTGSVTFSDINGEPLNARHPFARILHQSGFTPVPQGMRLY